MSDSLSKINIEKCEDLLDYVITKINKESKDDTKEGQKLSCAVLNKAYELARRNHISNMQFHESFDELDRFHTRMSYLNTTVANLEANYADYTQFGVFRAYYQAWLYIDLCCYTILQFVIHGIMRNHMIQDKLNFIEEINKTIRGQILRAKSDKSKINLKGTPEEMMFQIFSYYYRKDRFLQDVEIIKMIENSDKKRKKPLPEYSLIKYTPKNEAMDWKDLQEVFLEGEEAKTIKTFKTNIMKCYKNILRFDSLTGRRIWPEPISLRVFYREIYGDKAMYNNRQSKTIFNNFLKYGKIGNSDYFYIDEKINAGMFREYGLVEEYHAKNQLQENLYCLVCYSLAKLTPFEMVETFRNVMNSVMLPIEIIGCEAEDDVDVLEISHEMINEAEGISELSIRIIKENLRQMEDVNNINWSDIAVTMKYFFELYNRKFPEGEI